MKQHLFGNGRLVVWFSCGAASAVAAKIACTEYADEDLHICYCDTSVDEHPDNGRFLADVERWIGRPIERLQSERYRCLDDVFRGERYLVGPTGAPCTKWLKQLVRVAYQLPTDTHVLGYTADEAARAKRFDRQHPDLDTEWLLIDRGITKAQCLDMLVAAGIELPMMYRLGYHNNNCIGCVKATSAGYWNRIRRDFPGVFLTRCMQEDYVGASIRRKDGKPCFLEDLDPADNYFDPLEVGECGAFSCARDELRSQAAKDGAA